MKKYTLHNLRRNRKRLEKILSAYDESSASATHDMSFRTGELRTVTLLKKRRNETLSPSTREKMNENSLLYKL